MQLEVFDYNAYVYVHTASRLSFEAEPLSTAHQHVLKLQFRLDTQQPRSQALHQTLGLGPPAFHTYCVLARSEGDSGNAIASDGVPSVVVYLPDFKDELGPTAQGLGFVVDVEGVVPDDGFFLSSLISSKVSPVSLPERSVQFCLVCPTLTLN